MVDWKRVPKIDAHIHLLPDDVIKANSGYNDPFVDYGGVREYLDVMKKYNIERAFIMPFNDPCMMSMDFAVETVHKNLHDMISLDTSRLNCFADVDIRRDVGLTISELERVLSQTGFLGIKLHPSNAGYPIDGEYYEQIFDFASRKGILVEVHSYPREHLNDDACSPIRIKNVLNRHPELKLSIAHLGGFQFEQLYGLNVYVNMSAVLPDIVGRFGIEKANEILRAFGVEKLIFASDYPDSRCLKPNEIYDTYFEMLGKMDFSLEEAERICKFNAMKMLYL